MKNSVFEHILAFRFFGTISESEVIEIIESYRQSLLSTTLSIFTFFGYMYTYDQIVMVLSIVSAILSSIVSLSSVYRFIVWLRQHHNGELLERESDKVAKKVNGGG